MTKQIHLQQEKTNSDAIQKEAAKNILQQLDADIYVVRWKCSMMYYWHKCSEMNDYSYVFI
jgi:hypothetical protein